MLEVSQRNLAERTAHPHPASSVALEAVQEETSLACCTPANSRGDLAGSSPKKFRTTSVTPKQTTSSDRFMQEIPEEIFQLILLNAVRGHEDLRNFALCCKRWGAFSTEDQWKKLCTRGWGNRGDIIQVSIRKQPEVSWRESYLRRLSEHRNGCLRMQQEITVSIRAILINWLLAVIDEFDQFSSFPHHQTVAYLDRYCLSEANNIQTKDLQMIGAACALMAMRSGRDVDDIREEDFAKAAYYTDGACTAEQVRQLAFELRRHFPDGRLPEFETPFAHIERLLGLMQKNYPTSSTCSLANYLGELALQAEISLRYEPQTLGVAAYALACHTLGWPETLWMPLIHQHAPGLTVEGLKPCLTELHALLTQALKLISRRNKKVPLPHVIVKYSTRAYQVVAKVIVTPSPWPSACPHGVLRSGHEPCARCLAGDFAAPAEEAPELEEQSDEESDAEDEQQEEAAAAALEQSFESPDPLPGDATPRDLDAQRHAARTPAGALLEAGAGPGPAAASCLSEGGEAGRQQVPLQDVSFGAISDGNDNSFLMERDRDDDRRASMGPGERRASTGSVLGAVLEEDPTATEGLASSLFPGEDDDDAWEGVQHTADDDEPEVLSDISIDLDREELCAGQEPLAMPAC